MPVRNLLAIAIVVILAGCSSKYRIDSYDVPTNQLDRSAAFYIPLPADGRYGGTVYEGSGAMTAQTVSAQSLAYVDKTVVGDIAGESVDDALQEAKEQGLSHVFYAVIINWEDRATEWSGITDKITMRMSVYEAETGEQISSIVTSASSKWGTFGGDHPQDLLPEPIRRFLRPLFE